jgi:hypothetical protein
MDAVVACGSDQSNAVAGLRRRVGGALLLTLAGSAAWAFDGDGSSISLPSTIPSSDQRERLQLDLSASSLPRFDNTDGSTRSSRIDMTLLPPRHSALGLSLGMTSNQGSTFAAAPAYVGAPTSVDLGLHWRYAPDGTSRIDVTAWRRVVPADALTLVQIEQPSYGARVEMRVSPVQKTGFVADRGFIGFQLEGGARVTLRRNGGKPMIYYRTTF